MLAVHTVGAGGGSIAWRDPGGALRVGPRSAGADPGPAAYGRGGTEPTVTDANLVLGYLAADAPLAGGVALDADAAQAAIGRLADSLGLDPIACAEGIVRVANAEMVRALRVVTVERGIDPRDYALLAFGGAGPLHAAQIADELGIERVLCPRASGVLAALGLVVAERRRDAQRTVLLSGDALRAEAVARVTGELGEQARRELGIANGELGATYELRYRGQSFELPVQAGTEPALDELREAFEAEHEARYGYRDSDQPLELVTVRLTATGPGAEVELAPEPGAAVRPGTEIEGPTVIALPESTVRVPDGWSGSVDRTGTIRLERR
jgi:N-methylhydantoinase A